MTTRYFIFISYKGSSYAGWQLQTNAVTVQQVLEEAIATILREKITTTGAGRTDSGVHASFFCAHFESRFDNLDTRKNLVQRLNKYLPEDIAVHHIRKVKNDAHARYSALSRTYIYYISRNKDPFKLDRSWYLSCELDIDSMNRACTILLNNNDFTSFSRLHSNARTNICNIHFAKWEDDGEMLVFTIKADRFLRNMVRAIVGTMVDVGQGKTSLADFEMIITAKDRCRAGKSAPAKGLFLADIEYPAEVYD